MPLYSPLFTRQLVSGNAHSHLKHLFQIPLSISSSHRHYFPCSHRLYCLFSQASRVLRCINLFSSLQGCGVEDYAILNLKPAGALPFQTEAQDNAASYLQRFILKGQRDVGSFSFNIEPFASSTVPSSLLLLLPSLPLAPLHSFGEMIHTDNKPAARQPCTRTRASHTDSQMSLLRCM
jgi:hypothetical protein